MASKTEIHEGKRKSSFLEQRRHLKSTAYGRFKIVSGFPASPEEPAPSPSLLPAWLPAAPLGQLTGWQSGHWPGDRWQLTDLLLCLKQSHETGEKLSFLFFKLWARKKCVKNYSTIFDGLMTQFKKYNKILDTYYCWEIFVITLQRLYLHIFREKLFN